MSPKFIRIASVVIMALGLIGLTFFDPTPEEGETAQFWIVPLMYFLTILGAVGLCWGWFKGRKV